MNPSTYEVVSTTKQDQTHSKAGQPYTDKQGNPQVRRGLRLEGPDVDSSVWHNCYLPANLALNPQRGDTVTGSINNGNFYLQGVISGGQAPQNGQAPTSGNAPHYSPQRTKEECRKTEAFLIAASSLPRGATVADLRGRAKEIYADLAGTANPPGNTGSDSPQQAPVTPGNGDGGAPASAPSAERIAVSEALRLANKMDEKGVDHNLASMQLVALGASAGKEILEGITHLTPDLARQFDSWLDEQPISSDDEIPF